MPELQIIQPKLILALGAHAHKALSQLGVQHVNVPHPAARISNTTAHLNHWVMALKSFKPNQIVLSRSQGSNGPRLLGSSSTYFHNHQRPIFNETHGGGNANFYSVERMGKVCEMRCGRYFIPLHCDKVGNGETGRRTTGIAFDMLPQYYGNLQCTDTAVI